MPKLFNEVDETVPLGYCDKSMMISGMRNDNRNEERNEERDPERGMRNPVIL